MSVLSYAEIDAICANYKHHLARWRRDPVAFCMEAFVPDKVKTLQYWQAEFFWDLAAHKKVARAAGHGVGKSFCLGRAPWWLMITQKNIGEPLKIPCTGPSGGNIEDVLWAEIRAAYGQLHPILQEEFVVQKDQAFHVSKMDVGDTDVDDGDAWFMRLRTARKENPEALQGFHGNPAMFIIDEAPGVPDEVFELAKGAMAGINTYGIMFGNPRRLSGYFHKSFHDRDSMWKTGYVNCEDHTVRHKRSYFFFDAWGRRREVTASGRVSDQYIQEMRSEYGEHSAVYDYRVRGQFPKDEADSLISHDWVQAAVNRPDYEQSVQELREKKRWMGVDVAYDGDDWSAIVVRAGKDIEHVEMWHGNDPTESADRVMQCYNDLQNSGMPVKAIFVDDLGVGAGVTSDLRRRGFPAVPVRVSESAVDDGGTRCKLVRDWLWWQCRLFFQRKRPRFAEQSGDAWKRLEQELEMPKYSTKGGKITVEPKDSIKKRLKRSPDIADALCLTFYRDTIGAFDKDKSASDMVSDRRKRKKKNRRARVNRWKTV